MKIILIQLHTDKLSAGSHAGNASGAGPHERIEYDLTRIGAIFHQDLHQLHWLFCRVVLRANDVQYIQAIASSPVIDRPGLALSQQ